MKLLSFKNVLYVVVSGMHDFGNSICKVANTEESQQGKSQMLTKICNFEKAYYSGVTSMQLLHSCKTNSLISFFLLASFLVGTFPRTFGTHETCRGLCRLL